MIYLFEKKDTRIYRMVGEFLRTPTIKISELTNLLDVSLSTLTKDIAETNELFQKSNIKAHIALANQEATIDRTASFSLSKLAIFLFERSFKGNILLDAFYERKIDIDLYTYSYDMSEASFYRKINELKTELVRFNLQLNTKPIELYGSEQDIRYFYLSLFWGVYRGIQWPFTIPREDYLEKVQSGEKAILFSLPVVQKERWLYWIAVIEQRRRRKHFVSSLSTKYGDSPMKIVSFLTFIENPDETLTLIPEKHITNEGNYETSIAETTTFVSSSNTPIVYSYIRYHQFHDTELWQVANYLLELVLDNSEFLEEVKDSPLFMMRLLTLLLQTNRNSYHYQSMFYSLLDHFQPSLLDTSSRSQEILANKIAAAITITNTKFPHFNIKDEKFLIASLSESILGGFKFNFYNDSYNISLLLENLYTAELIKKQISALNYKLTISTENEDIKKADLIICENYTESIIPEINESTQVFVLAKSYLTQRDLDGINNFLRTAKS
ncbi:helix-turn-helix domain-containing protein [Enterococcus wangshanyuanii]|uniref:Mga helix-turn-helix domain-containing protein n=1 Tax=Enterococcus wangshanyuanii TaxID=2005703 RepID=A0ABQ1PTY3_9ENTE|nr:helix-turn-helix domain-containing protein [Enterococcus wangshanyuanii]GGD03045.1 hypothetical protein GCM10011573_35660 [Enterococcus wangshanyuanii]